MGAALIAMAITLGQSREITYEYCPRIIFKEEVVEQPKKGFGGQHKKVYRQIIVLGRHFGNIWVTEKTIDLENGEDFPEVTRDGPYWKFRYTRFKVIYNCGCPSCQACDSECQVKTYRYQTRSLIIKKEKFRLNARE